MILGIMDSEGRGAHLREELEPIALRLQPRGASCLTAGWAGRQLAVSWIPGQHEDPSRGPRPYVSQDQTIVVMAEGRIYNAGDLRSRIGIDPGCQTPSAAEIIGRLYEKRPQAFLDPVNGQFAFVLWDEVKHALLLGRDRLGIESLFYSPAGPRLVFGSSLRGMMATGWVPRRLNHEAVLQYLLYCYNPTPETLVRNVFKVPAGHVVSVHGSTLSATRYWRLSFAETQVKTEGEYREEVLELIQDAIRIRLDPHRPAGVFLSGGTDSSAIVSLASRLSTRPIQTFSFRCQGRSYDESPYARFVANHYGTRHTEVPYGPECLSLITSAVEWMDEPFCDVGIEIGTYLLGRAAGGNVDHVFSGEGGDELFGGHPVYVADTAAALVNRMPRLMLTPLAHLLQRIPDSDQKKNLQVKLKRFAYSLAFPPELLSHRWRAYYTPVELRALCTRELLADCDMDRVFEGMLRHTREADGRDRLSRSLHADYSTLVDFYLRRLGLLRQHSIERRLPLLDHRLVEYAAKIPSRLKIRHLSETKYIYRRILEGVLPAEILHNRPKLGHSVPMKNWLRENGDLREWAWGILGDGTFRGRGFFRPPVVRRMLDEHVRKSHNHSHRLWGLIVMESWLRSWFDPEFGASPPAAGAGASLPGAAEQASR
jgi:asparagine synthase (glutamine-hydrolysing)